MFEDDINEVAITANDGRVVVNFEGFELELSAVDALGFGRLLAQVAIDELKRNMPEDGIFKV